MAIVVDLCIIFNITFSYLDLNTKATRNFTAPCTPLSLTCIATSCVSKCKILFFLNVENKKINSFFFLWSCYSTTVPSKAHSHLEDPR